MNDFSTNTDLFFNQKSYCFFLYIIPVL